MPNLYEEFRAIVATLGRSGIPYAVCGGIAMSVHSHPRATLDIDLLAPADAVPSIVAALGPHGFVRRETTPTSLAAGQVVMHPLTKIVPGDPEVLVLDVIEARTGATEAAWQTRTSADWEGHPVTVVSAAGLIALKRLRGSPQDVADIAALEGQAVTAAERSVLATSQARDLCLSLRRAFIGPRAVQAVRAGQAARLTASELRIALGLAWAAGDLALMRAALASVPADRIRADPVLSAFRDVAR